MIHPEFPIWLNFRHIVLLSCPLYNNCVAIAWQVLNKVTYPQDKHFSKNILLIAPGLTVKSRPQVLVPRALPGNYYTEFQINTEALIPIFDTERPRRDTASLGLVPNGRGQRSGHRQHGEGAAARCGE